MQEKLSCFAAGGSTAFAIEINFHILKFPFRFLPGLV